MYIDQCLYVNKKPKWNYFRYIKLTYLRRFGLNRLIQMDFIFFMFYDLLKFKFIIYSHRLCFYTKSEFLRKFWEIF